MFSMLMSAVVVVSSSSVSIGQSLVFGDDLVLEDNTSVVFNIFATSPSVCRLGSIPDPACTPGEVLPIGVDVICHQPSSARRHVSIEMKRQVFAEYNVSIPDHWEGQWEIDHLVPVCAAGASTLANLWPQAAPDYHLKDKAEDWGCREVCAGRMPLADFQHQMETDWRVIYARMPK
jgi:hypothetical protein